MATPIEPQRNVNEQGEDWHLSTPCLGDSQHGAVEAQGLFQRELSHNTSLSSHQRGVLETALSFVKQISRASSSTVQPQSTWNQTVDKLVPEATTAEILHIVMQSMLLVQLGGFGVAF